MISLREQVPLAPLSSLGVGGASRFFAEVYSKEDVVATLGEAKRRGLKIAILGGGSNMLVPDEGIDGLVMHISIPGIETIEDDDSTLLIVGAGVEWDSVVGYASEHNLWGIENLAGIPGTVGAAPVQNIGAYGTELSSVFSFADAINIVSGETVRVHGDDASFGYRTSVFKRSGAFIITRVALRLSTEASPDFSYKDLAPLQHETKELSVNDITNTIRGIRANKFPTGNEVTTAGSFFKNPILAQSIYESLCTRFPGLPGFKTSSGVKVPLAWILHHVLKLSGYTRDSISLYERQPMVLVVTGSHTQAKDIESFARDIEKRVYDATGILIEREVLTFAVR